MAKRRRRKPTPGEEVENFLTSILALALLALPFYVYSKTNSLIFAIVVFIIGALFLVVGYRVIRSLLIKSVPQNKTSTLEKSKKSDTNNKRIFPTKEKINDSVNEHIGSISSSTNIRPDEVILKTPLKKLSAYEFERLVALYLRDHGYEVEEIGGVADGGVDLIATDKQGYRTAVQAKHWNFGPVGPDVIRETHSARLNTKPSCHLAMVVTSADITPQARMETDARRMEYWAGHVFEDKLSRWPKWNGAPKQKTKLSRTK